MFRTTFAASLVLATAFAGLLAAQPAAADFCTVRMPVEQCGGVDADCSYLSGVVNLEQCYGVDGDCVALAGVIDLSRCVDFGACIGDYQVAGEGCLVQTAPTLAFRHCGDGTYALWLRNAQTYCMRILP